ncbi:uncharacterized protein RHOBADRAFT_54526 [Rhodotorula graminis WP1]|uniref:F-box domain-containing protein n=1 Tax=Rhodotorula graminis (strain WP1) TaxID=578459 RepID=A0A0P9IW10_RHOGW|nr:uncharacterized protein RHOBADRAFT_54526 [Rhodotorula graminis WP1]KPV73942.1 hypothetical protein RHOBADRAFT_54526 [Rhodotorula graminis WP1]
MDNEIFISASSPDHSPPFPLLRLPNELIDKVFEHAYADQDDRVLGRMPACRRLAPIQRAHLYRRVEIHSPDEFALFRRTVVTTPEICKLVMDLSIFVRDEHDGLSDPDEDGEALSPEDVAASIIPPSAIAAVLSRLSRIEALRLDGLRSARLAVVLSETASHSLASIKRLVLQSAEGEPGHTGNEYDADAERAWVGQLVRLSALEFLSVAQNRTDAPVLPVLRVPLTLPRVTRLSLKGTIVQETWRGPDLRTLVPQLVDLEMADFSPVIWFASLLNTAPTGLRKLSMKSVGVPVDSGAAHSIHGILPRFDQLEHLVVCNGVLSKDLNLRLQCLRSLEHIRSLRIFGPIATDELLAHVLKDAGHLPRLERLGLSHIVSSKGGRVADVGRAATSSTRCRWEHWPMCTGWFAPEYPSGCTEAGLRQAMTAAEARGIVVEGTTLEALEWHAAFEAERRAAHLAHGDEQRDHRLARQVLGDVVVDEHLVARATSGVTGVAVAGEAVEDDVV